MSLFKLKVKSRRFANKILKTNRPGSWPYISGDGFRSLATFVYDQSLDFNPADVSRGDIIFVRGDFLISFFQTVHPRIPNNYILISHNADNNIDAAYTRYLEDGKIIHWFAQNALVDHEKVTPLPIGLQLRHYDRKNTTVDLLRRYANKNDRFLKIFFGFNPHTNKAREHALGILKQNSYCATSTSRMNTEEYYAQVSSYAFNASPEGNGIDCHRTWESLYLGTIPVVEKNAATSYWQRIGIPLFLIDTWSNLDSIDEARLKQSYEELKGAFACAPLYMDYWVQEILKYKQ